VCVCVCVRACVTMCVFTQNQISIKINTVTIWCARGVNLTPISRLSIYSSDKTSTIHFTAFEVQPGLQVTIPEFINNITSTEVYLN